MRLRQIELTNVCQHAHLLWDLPLGLVGIFGPNGSGKSNTLNMAYASLTNDFSRNAGLKAANIREGTTEDQKSEIRTVWEHSGHSFEITLGLKPTRYILSRAGYPDITGAKEVQAAISEIIGVSKNILDTHIFVKQWAIFDWLTAPASERAKLFGKLCNTEIAEKVWLALGPAINFYGAKAGAPTEDELNLDELKREYNSFVKQYKSVKTECNRLQEVSADNRQALQQIVLNYQKTQQLLANERAYKTQIEALNKRLKIFLKIVKDIPADCETNLAALSKQELEINLRLEQIRKFLNTFKNGVANCPVCGTPAENLQEHIQEEKAQYVSLKTQADKLSKEISDLRQLKNKLDEANNQIALIRGTLQIQTELLEKVQTQLQGTVTAEQAKEAENSLLEIDKLVELKTQKTIELNNLTNKLESLKSRIEKAKELIELRTKYRDAVAHLSNIRNIVHRDNLPRLIHQHAVANLMAGINENLENFGSPFKLDVTDDLEFFATFKNGVKQPVARLSGGQLVVCALAGRLELNRQFAGELGMLVLDEPTAGLDQFNLDCLETVFSRLAAQTKKRGHQVIMVTHESSLANVFDKVLTLERTN